MKCLSCWPQPAAWIKLTGLFHSVCKTHSAPSHDTAGQVSMHHLSSHHSYLLRGDKQAQSVLGWFRRSVSLWQASRVGTCLTIAFSWLIEGCYPPTVSSLHMVTWHLPDCTIHLTLLLLGCSHHGGTKLLEFFFLLLTMSFQVIIPPVLCTFPHFNTVLRLVASLLPSYIYCKTHVGSLNMFGFTYCFGENIFL